MIYNSHCRFLIPSSNFFSIVPVNVPRLHKIVWLAHKAKSFTCRVAYPVQKKSHWKIDRRLAFPLLHATRTVITYIITHQTSVLMQESFVQKTGSRKNAIICFLLRISPISRQTMRKRLSLSECDAIAGSSFGLFVLLYLACCSRKNNKETNSK